MSELIYGLHAVNAALQHQPQRIEILWIQRGARQQRLEPLMRDARRHGIEPLPVERTELDRLTDSARHQGVVARLAVTESGYRESDLDRLLVSGSKPPLLLVLDGVQDPHNLGACLRSADAAGVNAVIAPADRAVGLTPTVRKVASGAAETVPFVQVGNLARTLRRLREQGLWLVGAAGEADTELYSADLGGSLALVLGAENKGLRRLTRELCDQLVCIPMSGSVASLNVSVATGILLFEAVRQRAASHRR
jgi:23S rRNA (guanosine2251-2'-O)-methyltransferase